MGILKRLRKKEKINFEERKAIFSKDGKYRYLLSRIWDNSLPKITFIMLNPSTADGTKDDPTISKCIYYARTWGYGGLYVGNLFAFKATYPEDLLKTEEPVGQDCDHYLFWMKDRSELVLAAWGNHGPFKNRASAVCHMIGKLYCLDITNSGQPKHLLYLSNRLRPIPYATRRKF